jgi:DNA (cytosine-5)-methyltransferase 1
MASSNGLDLSLFQGLVMNSKKAKREPHVREFTAVDLFSGAGGVSLGLQLAGFTLRGAIESDELAASTYRKNFPSIRVLQADIRTVDPALWAHEVCLSPSELDLLAACPPCQGFSTIRTRNKASVPDDLRNELLFEVARFAAVLKPNAVMMENVPGLRRDSKLKDLCSTLEKLGYDVMGGPRVVDAADFGVPQRRRRLVLIASRIGKVQFPVPDCGQKTVRQAFEKLGAPNKRGDLLHESKVERCDRISRLIAAVPLDGGSRRGLPEEFHLTCHNQFDGFKDVYGRMAWDKPAPTITGGCFNPSKGRFLHPAEDRAITLREAAVLQGFPVDYFFSLSRGRSGAAKLIGNAFPPEFARAHAAAIRSALLDCENPA